MKYGDHELVQSRNGVEEQRDTDERVEDSKDFPSLSFRRDISVTNSCGCDNCPINSFIKLILPSNPFVRFDNNVNISAI